MFCAYSTRMVSDRACVSGGQVPDRRVRREITLWEASGCRQLDSGQWLAPQCFGQATTCDDGDVALQKELASRPAYGVGEKLRYSLQALGHMPSNPVQRRKRAKIRRYHDNLMAAHTALSISVARSVAVAVDDGCRWQCACLIMVNSAVGFHKTCAQLRLLRHDRERIYAKNHQNCEQYYACACKCVGNAKAFISKFLPWNHLCIWCCS